MMAGQMRLHRKGLMLLPQVTVNDKGVPGVMETLPAEVTTIDLLNCAIRTAPGENFATGRAWPRMAGTLLRRVLWKQQPESQKSSRARTRVDISKPSLLLMYLVRPTSRQRRSEGWTVAPS